MPFLRDELQISYTTGGLHFSAYAAGYSLSGILSRYLPHRWGRSQRIWGAAGGMAIAALALAFGRSIWLTVPSAGLIGVFGSMLWIAVQAALSDWQAEHRTIAISEANVAASLSASLVPLLMGQTERIGWGWRAALYLAVLVLIGMSVRSRAVTIPERSQTTPSMLRQGLPKRFWLYWGVLFLAVAIEFCLFFWGADFLETGLGWEKSNAVSAMSLYRVAGFMGRVLGSGLSRKIRGERLLMGAIAFAGLGFPLLWLGQVALLNLFGLAIAGIGVANFYPLISALALGTVGAQSDAASARLAIAVGMAIFVAPFLLGWIADQVEIWQAMGFVMVLWVGLAIAAYGTTLRSNPQNA